MIASLSEELKMDVKFSSCNNVRIAFEDWNKPLSEMLPGYSKLTCHLIFEIKLSENFRRKARFVADGHKHPVKPSLSYSTVVSRDSVRIAFLLRNNSRRTKPKSSQEKEFVKKKKVFNSSKQKD